MRTEQRNAEGEGGRYRFNPTMHATLHVARSQGHDSYMSRATPQQQLTHRSHRMTHARQKREPGVTGHMSPKNSAANRMVRCDRSPPREAVSIHSAFTNVLPKKIPKQPSDRSTHRQAKTENKNKIRYRYVAKKTQKKEKKREPTSLVRKKREKNLFQESMSDPQVAKNFTRRKSQNYS